MAKIWVLDAGTWKQANNPTSNLLYTRFNDTWYGAANTWIRDADTWKQITDYVGVPNAPSNLRVTSAATNYTTLSLAWDAPVGGAPVSYYRVGFYRSDGSWITHNDVTAPTTTLNYAVVADEVYQIEVWSFTSAGQQSSASNRVRYGIGHPQQTRQDPVYNWGTAYDVDTATVYQSTTAVVGGTTYYGTYATDGNLSTAWYGGSRSSSTYFDAVRVNVPSGGYRRVWSVRCRSPLMLRMWLGMAQDGTWYNPPGGTYPNNVNLWFDSTARTYFSHNYLMWTPEWSANTDYDFVINDANPAYVFSTDRCTIDVAVDSLKSALSGTRGALTEVTVRVQDWTIVSYNTVETVAQKNGYYW